jgi:NADH dehydrogenase
VIGRPTARRAGSDSPHVVIVGAGFGGLAAARRLRRAAANVTVVDRRNHHLFQPLLYQVATAALNPSDIAMPIRTILRRQRNTRVLLGDVEAVDVEKKQVRLRDGEIRYDYLVLAPGATHSYFGHDTWAQHAPGLKTVEDALEIRRRVLLAYEAAERESDVEQRRAWMTFVIVGGGPTGVELAGALAEIAHHALEGDFRVIDPSASRIVLVEGAPHVLPTYVERLSERARQQLVRLGVDVITDARVTAVDDGGVEIGPMRVPARTVIWAAGVTASPLARSLGVPLDRAGRVRVTPTLTVPNRDDVFVIGDLAAFEQDGSMIPGVSPVAIQEGRHTAMNIERAIAGRPLLPFRYVDKGSFAVIGRGAAVGQIGKRLRVSGPLAWVAWLLIHIFYLIGFRNRLAVLLGWAYSYLTFRRAVRLITGDPLPPLPRVMSDESARHTPPVD